MDTGTTGSDATLLLVVVGVMVTVSTLLVLSAVMSRHGRGGAPSPRSLPLLGHLLLLEKPLHRSLAALAATHGGAGGSVAPVLSLRLGARRALLVSAHAVAFECFTERDASLAGRPRLLAGEVLGYGCTDILWAPYGDHWRTLRKFFSVELLSASRLAARAADRRAEVAALVENLLRDADRDGGASPSPATVMTLRPKLFEFVINVMLRALIGACLRRSDAGKWQEIVEESVRLNAAPSVGDLYPALRWVDRLRRVDAALARLQAKRDALLVDLIDEQRRKRDDASSVRDTGSKFAIDELLFLQEVDPSYYTDTVIKGIVM